MASPSPNSALYDTSDQIQTSEDEVDDEDEEEESGTEAVRRSLRADADEYEEDFVDDNEEELLGAPHGLDEIPLEFTHHAFRKPIENFRFAVEWMIHNKLNPAFARNDQIYEMAVRKLDDEVQGFAGSKFLSSVWNGGFTKALKGRPDLSVIQLPSTLFHNCDACQRSGHPAKYQVVFSGKPYNRKTLEDLSNNDDDDDYDAEIVEDDKISNDDQDDSQTFYLGR